MRKFYTRHDVEHAFRLLRRQGKWPRYMDSVNVYGGKLEILVTDQDLLTNPAPVFETLSQWFGAWVDTENRTFILETQPSKTLRIAIELEEDDEKTYAIPLFDASYRPEDAEYPPMFSDGPKLFAFHSYKGGVGRTLAALSFCRALSKRKKDGRNLRLLIVDADYEAPGMTWLARKQDSFQDFSLLDALAMVHDAKNWEESALEMIASKVQEGSLRLPVDDESYAEHFFLPAYREEEQLLFARVMPKHLVQFIGREWIIGDFLHQLGTRLDVDAVVVDLRAGISEFSAPLLFDPRVQKVLVSTTSLQAVEGSKMVLKEMMERMPSDNQQYPLPVFFTSMVTKESKSKVDEADAEILALLASKRETEEPSAPQTEKPTAQVEMLGVLGRIRQLEFNSALIHLEDFDHIGRKLKGTEFDKTIDETVEDLWSDWAGERVSIDPKHRQEALEKMQRLCHDLSKQNMQTDLPFFKTRAVRNLAQKFAAQLPSTAILGKMGSGKTFQFLQMVNRKTWNGYLNAVDQPSHLKDEVLLLPLLAEMEMSEDNNRMVADCLMSTRRELGAQGDFSLSKVRDRIREMLGRGTSAHVEWRAFWIQLMAESVGLPSTQTYSLPDLDRHLKTRGQKIVWILDGLSDWFNRILTDFSHQTAIRVLCQDIIPQMQSIPGTNIGMLAFVRKDLLYFAGTGNSRQSLSSYEPFEQKWDVGEVARLVLWVSYLSGMKTPRDIESAEQIANFQLNRVEEMLAPLWGTVEQNMNGLAYMKLTLSDFHGRFAVRYVIQCLRESANDSKQEEVRDRYFHPMVFKIACVSAANLGLSDTERKNSIVRDVLEKLFNPPDRGTVMPLVMPFHANDYEMTIEEAKYLETLGLLLFQEEGYYMCHFFLNNYWTIHKDWEARFHSYLGKLLS